PHPRSTLFPYTTLFRSLTVIDETATLEQRQALDEITSGRMGSSIFEIFAAVCPNRLATVFAPIAFEANRETRKGKYRVGALIKRSEEHTSELQSRSDLV